MLIAVRPTIKTTATICWLERLTAYPPQPDRRNEIHVSGDARLENAEELGKRNRHRGDRPGLHDQKHRPAEKEAEERRVGIAQEARTDRRLAASWRRSRRRWPRRRPS